MKQFWVLLACMCGLIPVVKGQSGIGLRGGPVLSQVNYTFTRPEPPNTVTGPSQALVQGMEVGVVGRFMNSKHLGLQTEINYSRQGWHIYQETEGEHKAELEMVQVPVMSYLQLGRGKLKFTVQAGAFVGYVHKRNDIISPPQEVPGLIRYSHQEELPWQYGVLVGGGPSFTLPFGVITLEGRFSHSLSNLIRSDFTINDDFVDFDAFNLQTITFGLQWVYMFKQ